MLSAAIQYLFKCLFRASRSSIHPPIFNSLHFWTMPWLYTSLASSHGDHLRSLLHSLYSQTMVKKSTRFVLLFFFKVFIQFDMPSFRILPRSLTQRSPPSMLQIKGANINYLKAGGLWKTPFRLCNNFQAYLVHMGQLNTVQSLIESHRCRLQLLQVCYSMLLPCEPFWMVLLVVNANADFCAPFYTRLPSGRWSYHFGLTWRNAKFRFRNQSDSWPSRGWCTFLPESSPNCLDSSFFWCPTWLMT